MIQELSDLMVDLHGSSVEEAENTVLHWLAKYNSTGIRKIRFVTGRGNHINSKGKRGTLYNDFPKWLERSACKDSIASWQQHDGYYEVIFKPRVEPSQTEQFFDAITKHMVVATLPQLKTSAENGEVDAQILYAQLLEKGEVVTQDFKLAASFFRSAADQNSPIGMHEVARCYLMGMGVRQSDTEAVVWLKKADKLNHVISTVELGDRYWLGEGVPQDDKIAISYYAKAAARNNPLAMRKLGFAYREGIVVVKNLQTAFNWYKKAADLGETTACYNVAVCYHDGIGTEKNLEESFRYHKLAAEYGDPDSQFTLSRFYHDGIGTAVDQAQADSWLHKAAKNGSTNANHLLAHTAESSSREEHLRRSAQAGNIFAKAELALNGRDSKSLSKDERADLMNKTLKQSYRLTHNDILSLEFHSKFFLIDSLLMEKKLHYKEKALDLLNAMAETKCIYSLRRLAFIHIHGNSALRIAPDSGKQVIEYLTQGVTEGDSKAMYILGNHYLFGRYVNKSDEQAVKYYEDAAKLKHPSACCHLGIFYFNQHNSLEDLRLAAHYFQLAIDYENTDEIVQQLSSGLLDKHESILDRATKELAQVREKINHWIKAMPKSLAINYLMLINSDTKEKFASDVSRQEEYSRRFNSEFPEQHAALLELATKIIAEADITIDNWEEKYCQALQDMNTTIYRIKEKNKIHESASITPVTNTDMATSSTPVEENSNQASSSDDDFNLDPKIRAYQIS